MYNIIITEPTPVPFQDKCQGVPQNIFTKGIQDETFGGMREQFLVWAEGGDSSLGIVDGVRAEALLDSISCDEQFQAGEYSIRFWRS